MKDKYIKIPDWIYYGTGSVTLTYERPDKVMCSSVFFPIDYEEVKTEQAKELEKELADKNEYLQKREDYFIKKLAQMVETQPGRGRAIVRIKKDDSWYIPQITTYLNSPEGIIIEGEI